MRDSSGRNIDYLRISITDRCNLRCRYCMPFGVESVPRWEMLSLEEILAVAVCAAGLGIRHIRVTGGEPLVRRDCVGLVRRLKAVEGIETVTLTTNGLLLSPCLEELQEAGIDGINISLDTLNRERYRQITGTDGLDQVWKALEMCLERRIPVKLNAVSAELGRREGERPDWRELAELAYRLPVDVRFIELMPIGFGKDFPALDHERLLAELREAFPGLTPDRTRRGCGPARYWRAPQMKGSIGLISAIHGKFCGSCNRIRLTAQGYLKACLCYETGADLRAVLREGERFSGQEGHYRWPEERNPAQEELQERLRAVMAGVIGNKPEAHCFERPDEMTEIHNMNAIGG